MSAGTVRRILRPQNFVVVIGMGMLSVATFGLAAATVGLTLPLAGEITTAALGMLGGVKAVLASA